MSPARLAVLVALVVGGIAIMMNGFGDDDAVLAGGSTASVEPTGSSGASPTGAASPTSSESPPPELEPQVDGVMIQVLNGTSEVGLASQVEDFLELKGYRAALPAADAPQKPVETTIVYFRTGDDAEQNEVDAGNLASAVPQGRRGRCQTAERSARVRRRAEDTARGAARDRLRRGESRRIAVRVRRLSRARFRPQRPPLPIGARCGPRGSHRASC